MREAIKRKALPKDLLINEIVDIEWQMMDKVNNQGGRAACQDDEWTFYVMRYSQFMALPVILLESYRDDLYQALAEGRNVLVEKYAYMMAYTDPEVFDATLRAYIPEVSAGKEALVERVATALMKAEKAFAAQYPRLHQKGRPLSGTARDEVSAQVYTLGELKTYSEKTLRLYENYLALLEAKGGENISVTVHRIMALLYGYHSLDEAEARQV
ncbi:MAG: DUF4125 family protein [Peptococcaceae bacterium]|nr:DUF4125 family protein [Peptococcaceae bacterium]